MATENNTPALPADRDAGIEIAARLIDKMVIGYYRKEQYGTCYTHRQWDSSWLPAYAAAPAVPAGVAKGEQA